MILEESSAGDEMLNLSFTMQILSCICEPVHAFQSNSVLLFSALLPLDPAHMGRAEKGELRLAGWELSFIFHPP